MATASRISAASRLYAVVWRWHFYAGLITVPVLRLVAVTGTLYVLKTELVEWCDQAVLNVTTGPERMSDEALRKVATKAMAV